MQEAGGVEGTGAGRRPSPCRCPDQKLPTVSRYTLQATVPVLPAGWLARESRTYPGRFFFVGARTGLTTWEQPKVKKLKYTKPVQSARPFF